jgi:hypothetical protein
VNIGEPFNPWRRFHTIIIPDAIAQYPELSPGAKLVYGTLLRFAGHAGLCYPSERTIGSRIAISERQVRRHLGELRKAGLVDWTKGSEKRTNNYRFLWHSIFIMGTEVSANDRTEVSADNRTEVSAKENQVKENHVSEKHDFDPLPSNRKTGDSPSDAFPVLRETLRNYFGEEPPKWVVLACMSAGDGASEQHVCHWLDIKRLGYPRGSKNGPDTWAWFPAVVQDCADQRQEKRESTHPERFMPSASVGVVPDVEVPDFLECADPFEKP